MKKAKYETNVMNHLSNLNSFNLNNSKADCNSSTDKIIPIYFESTERSQDFFSDLEGLMAETEFVKNEKKSFI